jgi:hypothetical protein
LLIDVFNYYIEEKLQKDSSDINKYLGYAEDIGEIAQSGQKYIDNIKFYNVKNAIRGHIDGKILDCNILRNKVLGHHQ